MLALNHAFIDFFLLFLLASAVSYTGIFCYALSLCNFVVFVCSFLFASILPFLSEAFYQHVQVFNSFQFSLVCFVFLSVKLSHLPLNVCVESCFNSCVTLSILTSAVFCISIFCYICLSFMYLFDVYQFFFVSWVCLFFHSDILYQHVWYLTDSAWSVLFISLLNNYWLFF